MHTICKKDLHVKKTIYAHEPQYFARLEIDELFVSPGNAYKLLATDQTITGQPLRRSDPAQKESFKSNHPYIYFLQRWLYFQAYGWFD